MPSRNEDGTGGPPQRLSLTFSLVTDGIRELEARLDDACRRVRAAEAGLKYWAEQSERLQRRVEALERSRSRSPSRPVCEEPNALEEPDSLEEPGDPEDEPRLATTDTKTVEFGSPGPVDREASGSPSGWRLASWRSTPSTYRTPARKPLADVTPAKSSLPSNERGLDTGKRSRQHQPALDADGCASVSTHGDGRATKRRRRRNPIYIRDALEDLGPKRARKDARSNTDHGSASAPLNTTPKAPDAAQLIRQSPITPNPGVRCSTTAAGSRTSLALSRSDSKQRTYRNIEEAVGFVQAQQERRAAEEAGRWNTTVRGHARHALDAASCRQCVDFFRKAASSAPDPEAEFQRLMKVSGRHRYHHAPPETPPDRWALSFDETETQPPPGYRSDS